MARDGFLPRVLSRVSSGMQVPWTATLVVGFFTAALALLLDTDMLARVTSLGSAAAFVFVCLGVIQRRVGHREPRWKLAAWYLALECGCMVFSTSIYASWHWAASLALAVAVIGLTVPFFVFVCRRDPRGGGGVHVGECRDEPTPSGTGAAATGDGDDGAPPITASTAVVAQPSTFPHGARGGTPNPPHAPFSCPWIPFVPLCGAISSTHIFVGQGGIAIVVFAAVLLLASAWYAAFRLRRAIRYGA